MQPKRTTEQAANGSRSLFAIDGRPRSIAGLIVSVRPQFVRFHFRILWSPLVVSVGYRCHRSCILLFPPLPGFTSTYLQAGTPLLPRLLTVLFVLLTPSLTGLLAGLEICQVVRCWNSVKLSALDGNVKQSSHRDTARAKRIRNGLEGIRETCNHWIFGHRVTWWTGSSYRSVSRDRILRKSYWVKRVTGQQHSQEQITTKQPCPNIPKDKTIAL
jgi:hypothetical protein